MPLSASSSKPLIVFAHGKESGPWGSKIRHLAEVARAHGAEVHSPDYSDLPNANHRVERLLQSPLPDHELLILVGSSMGGYVSTVASRTLKPTGIFLMAPAFGMPTYDEPSPKPHACDIEVVMGWQDEVIPPSHVIAWAGQHNARLHLLASDHRLNAVLDEVGWHFTHFLRRIISPWVASTRVDGDGS